MLPSVAFSCLPTEAGCYRHLAQGKKAQKGREVPGSVIPAKAERVFPEPQPGSPWAEPGGRLLHAGTRRDCVRGLSQQWGKTQNRRVMKKKFWKKMETHEVLVKWFCSRRSARSRALAVWWRCLLGLGKQLAEK